jgi:hypothetical protein
MQGHSVQTTVGSNVDAEVDVDIDFLPVTNFCSPGFGKLAIQLSLPHSLHV